MVCAKWFYTSNLEVYAGKQPEGPFRVESSGKVIVERLLQPISGTRRNVTVDNWFCSIPLWSMQGFVSEQPIDISWGRWWRTKEIPPVFIDTKRKEPGDVTFGFKNDCTPFSILCAQERQSCCFAIFNALWRFSGRKSRFLYLWKTRNNFTLQLKQGGSQHRG